MDTPTVNWINDPSILPNDRSEIHKLCDIGDHISYLDEPKCSDETPIAIDGSELSQVISDYNQGFQILTGGKPLF